MESCADAETSPPDQGLTFQANVRWWRTASIPMGGVLEERLC